MRIQDPDFQCGGTDGTSQGQTANEGDGLPGAAARHPPGT